MYHHQDLQRGRRALVRAVGLAVIAFCCSDLVSAAEPPDKNAAPSPELVSVNKASGSKVLIDVLGEEFEGVIGCDYWGAYKKYMRLHESVQLQFCMAHLIRDVKYLATLSDKATKAYGERLREALREMFRVIHRREEVLPRTFERRLSAARDRVFATATEDVPSSNEAQNMANRFLKHGDSYFRFITTPGIEPTNNLAEQAIRFVVIDRRITQGTRSESGRD